MGRKTVKQAISDALEDLSSVNFGRFIEALLDRKDRDEPQVKRQRVEGKPYYMVADVLVCNYTASQVIPVVVEILRQIGCNEDADGLVKETSEESSKPGSSDGKHFVIKHKLELIDRVTNLNPILDELLDKGVIPSVQMYRRIRAKLTSDEKMRELYDGCLLAGGDVHDIFYQLLLKHEKFLVKDLEKKS